MSLKEEDFETIDEYTDCSILRYIPDNSLHFLGKEFLISDFVKNSMISYKVYLEQEVFKGKIRYVYEQNGKKMPLFFAP